LTIILAVHRRSCC